MKRFKTFLEKIQDLPFLVDSENENERLFPEIPPMFNNNNPIALSNLNNFFQTLIILKMGINLFFQEHLK